MALQKNNNKAPYFKAIDGLRLFASLNIVFFHLETIGGFTDLGGSPGWFFRIIKGPSFHATLFFLLGGFIFTSKFAPQAHEFKTWSFLKKRFKELYPLHAITTGMMILLVIIRTTSDGTLNIGKLLFSSLLHLTFLWPFFPFESYSLNRPSWALGAFFLCYLLFGVLLRIVNSFTLKRHLFAATVLSITPLIIWSVVYALSGTPSSLYEFFHIFPLIRLFEFVTGMVIARLFIVYSPSKSNKMTFHIIMDAVFILLLVLNFTVLGWQSRAASSLRFFSYHVILPLLFIGFLYTTILEKGCICRILSLSFVRKIGRSSFYPYLLHIPLISWITYISERFFNYRSLLHSSINIWIFIVFIYGGSFYYVNYFKKNRKLQ